ncbi:MAG: hypothetical protein WBE01_09860 [Methyloceanibacter sp.]
MTTKAAQARTSVGRFWDWTIDVGLILWITRVSVASALAGFALFLFVPQARDTFLEVRGDSLLSASNWSFWLVFFFFVIVFWVLPVHYCARRDLNYDPINTDPDRRILGKRRVRVDGLAAQIPRILAAACLIAIATGAFLATAGLRVPSDPDAEALYLQAHTQTYAIAAAAIALTIGVLLFFINRQVLTKKLGRTWRSLDEKFGRNFLIALTLVFFGLLLLPISLVENLSRAPLIPLLLGGWVPLLAWLALKGRVYRAPFILGLIVALELLTIAGNNHDVRTVEIDNNGAIWKKPGEKRNAASRYGIDELIIKWRRHVGCPPTDACDVRPIIIAASGGASRAGFFTAAIMGELVDVTQSDPSRYRLFEDQLFAISSVSGSSVGAAYFIAALLDSKAGKPPCNTRASPLVHFNRAAEGWRECMETLLSGDFLSSTLFAYVYKDALRGVAAMAASLGFPMPDRAVILEESWEDHYRRYTAKDCNRYRSDDCKEKWPGLARNFLGLAGVARPGRRVDADLLPDTVRVPEKAKPTKWVPLLFLNTTDVDTGRRVIASPVDPRVCGKFNGKCETSMQRLFPDAYDLHQLLADNPQAGRRLNQQGFVFDALYPGRNGDRIQTDILLSTAAGLSARFPFVSPPGNLKNKAGNLVARVVDGGYFENFGAGTAIEIANRLRLTRLDPVIIEITNDPELLGALELTPETGVSLADGDICLFDPPDPVCASDPPIIEVGSSFLFSGIRGPLSGLFGARAAQGGRALLQLANSGNTPDKTRNGCDPWVAAKDRSFIHFFVRPQYVYSSRTETCHMADVSMSWWLSKPVQAYLNAEVCESNLTSALHFMETGYSRIVATCKKDR